MRRLLAGFVDLLAVDVADSSYIDLRAFLELRHVVAAARPATDDAEPDLVVGAEDAGVGERCSGARAAQQITSSDVGGHEEIIRFGVRQRARLGKRHLLSYAFRSTLGKNRGGLRNFVACSNA